MKLIHCDGRQVTVRDVRPVVFRLHAGPYPLKSNGWHIVKDGVAKEMLRRFLKDGAVQVAVEDQR